MADLTLPTPNKSPGDGAPADDTNLIIEAINTLNSAVENIAAGPQGPQGEPGTPGAAGANASVTVGSTATGAAGSSAAVTNSGTAQAAVFNFTIPRGDTGVTGATGAQGAIGPTGATGPQGPTGYGVKAGGSSGYVLAKASNTDYDTDWIPAGAAPPVSSVDGRTGVVTLSDLYDAAGDASAAQTAAQSYADGLASNYDSAGSAAAAQTAAEGYADGLAANYDPAGSASAVAGDLTTHEGLTTSVHGISDTANLVYTGDSRLSDARTPTAHATSHESGGTDELELAPSQVTGTAVVDSDSRLTDARTPTAHASSHESGGSDELELAPGQITGTAVVANDVHLITFVTSGTRPGSPTEGMIIYETDTDLYFGWKGSAWSPIGGGATGGGTDDVFYENAQNVTTSYTLTTDKNAMTAGPVEIDSGVVVTIPSGASWVVV
jgi:hypothetical protein